MEKKTLNNKKEMESKINKEYVKAVKVNTDSTVELGKTNGKIP